MNWCHLRQKITGLGKQRMEWQHLKRKGNVKSITACGLMIVFSAEVITWCVGITMNSKQWWLMVRRLFFRCIQKNSKESIRRYVHLMHYSGPAATEQMLLDGSC
jgi:hypothetical protein